ncbi:MAG: hypothetical protein HC916_20815 [Coleofasciculaceae cyanobacterium SM2_1_6]|nr:hypothetical protein [Coleofasciculaceae cyanobacterium SM2_1_6]
MQIEIGQHKGKTIMTLVLKEPSYIQWILEQSNATGDLLKIRNEVGRLLEIFDSKPILSKCCGRQCKNKSVKFTGYVGNPFLIYEWCDECDPYDAGASFGRLVEMNNYQQALNYVEFYCGGSKKSCKEVIRHMALAKGLPKISRKAEVEKFFTT